MDDGDDWYGSGPHGPSWQEGAPCGGHGHDVCATADGAAWLESAAPAARAPGVLRCGTVFDVIGMPALFGRRVLARLWAAGSGCGPVAVHRGRILVFAAPGTAQRLPALLGWEEWARAVPPLLCYGTGDAVTVPSPYGPAGPAAPRWIVAPGTHAPWLPGAAVLLRACVRAARGAPAGTAAALVSAPVRP
jgi:hypothetical protein